MTDDGIDEELRAHLRMAVEERVARGEDPMHAERAVRREFGNLTHVTEVTREQALGWRRIPNDLLADARYAWRQLRASPALAAAVILSLALGIGANAAIFSLVNVAMLKPLPVQRPEELVQLTVRDGPELLGGLQPRFNGPMWDILRERQGAFAGLLAYSSTSRGDLSAGGESRPIAIGLVSGGFFETLGVRPHAGRLLLDADDVRECPGLVVLTHDFWRSEYGGDRGIVGRTIAINGRPYPVAGVAEPRFFGLGPGYYPPVWMPQCASRAVMGSAGRGGTIIARLKEGVNIEQARAHLAVLTPALADVASGPGVIGDPAEWRRITVSAEPFERGFRFLQVDYGMALIVLSAIVGVVLLIACANAANLLLARATARGHEFAVRVALGASRARILRQLLTESLLLSAIAASLGLLLAIFGSRLIIDLLSRRGTPMLREVPLDGKVLVFTVSLAVGTALLFGLAPAWRSARADAARAMTGGRVAAGHSRWNVARLLVVGQVALSLAMVVGAGLLIASWRTLVTLDPGFRNADAMLVGVSARATELTPRQRSEVFLRTLERLREMNGIRSASVATRTPLGTTGWIARVGGVPGDTGRMVVAGLNSISDGYFATIGTPLIAGRDFDRTDGPGTPRVAILSDSTARAIYGSAQAAVGRTLHVEWRENWTSEYSVVGVAANTKDQSLQDDMPALVYFAYAQDTAPEATLNFVLHGTGPRLTGSVHGVILAGHPRFSLTTRTIRHQVDEMLRLPRTLGVLSASFGVLALLLASIGLYGVISYAVARRRAEIGVRIALGADRGRIMRMVLGDVTRMVVPGVVIGVVLSLAAGKLVAAFLYDISATDTRVFVASAVLLTVVAFSAALVPARRASRVDPLSTLRGT